MSETTPALDEAFERMAAASFELPNGFVNHGAMACEALAELGCTGDIDGWARRFARVGGASVEPVAPVGFEWQQALGVYDHLPEWIGFFARAVDEDGWPAVVQTWVPRLMPGLRTALFHGAIRTAHAVRAIDAADTGPRRGELARALGYWAARYLAGQPASTGEPVDDVRLAVVHAAAQGARHYLARPDILNLHGVTGAMAVEILAGHIPATAAAAALAQVRAEHAVLYARTQPVDEFRPVSPQGNELVQAAVRSLDPHQVKLVEACRRGLAATGDPAFAAAAQTVTGLHLPCSAPAGGLSRPEWLNGLEKAEWVCHMIAAYILIETEAGKAATIAAALRDLPGVSEAAVLAGPYDVIARAQANSIDELARLAAGQVQALDGVIRTMSCPVVHL